MFQTNKFRILELFFEEPSRVFQIREISRLTKIAHTSVKNYLDSFRKAGLVRVVKTSIYKGFVANEQERMFRVYKQLFMLWRIEFSGLINFIEDELHPRCIVLFGSVRKGEYVKSSDIDLFVQSDDSVDLSRWDRRLKHKVNVIYESDINNIGDELFNNVINGIKLSGYVKVR